MKRVAIRDGFDWSVVDDRHRCSQPYCEEPAVAVLSYLAGGWGQRRHKRRRWYCAVHLANCNRFVRRDAVWMRVSPDNDWLTDLRTPWPPIHPMAETP